MITEEEKEFFKNFIPIGNKVICKVLRPNSKLNLESSNVFSNYAMVVAINSDETKQVQVGDRVMLPGGGWGNTVILNLEGLVSDTRFISIPEIEIIGIC